MKPEEVKTTGFEVIKAKAMQFPLDIIDVKPSIRSNISPVAFETTTPSLYALRFFSTSTSPDAVKSRLSKHRVKQTSTEASKEKSETHLSPIELTINKKIKYPQDRRKPGREKPQPIELTTSDRQIIEELRHQLRTRPRNGTTSVLEAIGDPEIREQRFYHEPLKTFLQEKDSGNKSFEDPGLPVVNIMIPSLEKGVYSDSEILLPLTLIRHHAAVSRNANRLRGGASVSMLPKVEGNSLLRYPGTQASVLKFYSDDNPPDHLRETHYVAKRKTQFVLPRIGLKRDDNVDDGNINKKRKGVATVNENRNKTTTVQLPSTAEDDFRYFNGFPRRATTTATGKAHLIGPMNKMNMIADYSKALQNGHITYNEYMKKLSVLSLHKVPLGNSVQRQFHLVRDGSNNMKPKLALVDVNSKTGTQISSMSSDQSESNKIQRPAATREKAKTSQGIHPRICKSKIASDPSEQSMPGASKSSQSQVHRVDIGEGLSLFEKPKLGPEMSDEIVLPDLTRYTHAHHPRQGRLTQYHWNHESAFGGPETWSNRHWPSSVTAKVPNKIESSLKNLEAAKDEAQEKQSSRKVLLSMEEYLKFHNPRASVNSKSSKLKSESLGGDKLENNVILQGSPDVINLAEENFQYMGKMPEINESEAMGLGAKEILRSVNLKLPGNPLSKEDPFEEEPSEIDSVFQGHLDNMLKTIKKAKVSQKHKVPELRGLMPTVIPQVLVDNSTFAEDSFVADVNPHEEGGQLHVDYLGVLKNIPKNSPPPTARKTEGENPQCLAGENISASVVDVIPPSNVKLIVDDTRRQGTPNVALNHPKTPKSVQSNRSAKFSLQNHSHDEAAFANNNEVRIMTASVDLIVPSNDDDVDDPSEGGTTDRSRLEVVITSMPVAPPASLATTSDDSLNGNEEG